MVSIPTVSLNNNEINSLYRVSRRPFQIQIGLNRAQANAETANIFQISSTNLSQAKLMSFNQIIMVLLFV